MTRSSAIRAEPAPVPASDAVASAAGHSHEALPSAQLLRGQTSIEIDHQGTRYVLRATRTGKLILTK